MKCRPVLPAPRPQDILVAGLEAEYFRKRKRWISAGNPYEISAQNGPVAVGGEKKEAWELLAHYLHEMLKLTGIAEVEKNIRSLSIAMDSLNAVQVENLQRACRELGIPEERTILLDYEESFLLLCYDTEDRNLEQKCRLVQL